MGYIIRRLEMITERAERSLFVHVRGLLNIGGGLVVNAFPLVAAMLALVRLHAGAVVSGSLVTDFATSGFSASVCGA